MKPTKSQSFRSRFAWLFSLILIALLAHGCASTSVQETVYDPRSEFDRKLDELMANLLDREHYTTAEMAPAAVMPGSLRGGTRFSRLEEIVMERLSMRLRQNHDVCKLSRQNWFEFREGRPLDFKDKPYTQRHYYRNLVVYEVKVSADDVLAKATVNIVASDADGKSVPGVMAACDLDFDYSAPARQLYLAEPSTNPYPEGLEERPYDSLDRLAFSLAAELADAYRTGLSADGHKPSDREVRVLLYNKPPVDVGPTIAYNIQNALQQAVVSNRGFTCVVSKEDFGPAFEQIDFYRRNYEIFHLEETKFTAGTVLLMVDSLRHSDGDKVGVALRALWRIGPLESDTGDLIPTNVAGTYLSGFTAKAYLYSDDIGMPVVATPPARTVYAPPERKVYAPPPRKVYTPPTPQTYVPAPVTVGDMDVCFYEFTEVFEKRIYPVLTDAPNVTGVQRLYDLCDGPRCVCYAVQYTGPREDLEAYLRQNLRTNKALAFRMIPRGANRLDVMFDGGFD